MKKSVFLTMIFVLSGMGLFSFASCDDSDTTEHIDPPIPDSNLHEGEDFAYYTAFIDTIWGQCFDVRVSMGDSTLVFDNALSSFRSFLFGMIPCYYTKGCGLYYKDSLQVEAQVKFKSEWQEVLEAQPDSDFYFFCGYAYATADFEERARTVLVSATKQNLLKAVKERGLKSIEQEFSERLEKTYNGYEYYDTSATSTITVKL